MIAIYIIRNKIISSYLLNPVYKEADVEKLIRFCDSAESTRLMIDSTCAVEYLKENNPEFYPALVVYDYQPAIMNLISVNPSKTELVIAEKAVEIFGSNSDFKERYMKMKSWIDKNAGGTGWKTLKDVPIEFRK